MSQASDMRVPEVGILGGVGPAATVDFYSNLIEAPSGATDQEHLRVVVWADPTVPDRFQAVAGGREDPTPKLAEGESPRLLIDPARLLAIRVVHEATAQHEVPGFDRGDQRG